MRLPKTCREFAEDAAGLRDALLDNFDRAFLEAQQRPAFDVALSVVSLAR